MDKTPSFFRTFVKALTTASLDVLQNIKLLDKRQQKDDPNAPTDLEIINALFESGEFQDWVTLIKNQSFKKNADIKSQILILSIKELTS